jgi:hypothetical protein
MLPTDSAVGPLAEIRQNGTPVPYTTQTVKGVEYAFFPASPGSYTARYGRAPTPMLSINSVSLQEGKSGSTKSRFTVSLSVASGQTVAVNYATQSGTAVAGRDFAPACGTLVFQPGQTEKTITVAVKGDRLYEDDEVFRVSLGAPTGAMLDPRAASGTGTIQNDDATPAVSIGSVSVKEGGPATTTIARFTVTLSSASGRPTTVPYATADGTATIVDNDYQAAGGSVTFAPGETRKTISILVNGDSKYEAKESFVVILGAPDGAAIAPGKGVGTGTIRNDDALPRVWINDVTVCEDPAGTSTAQFLVSLSAPSGLPVTAKYATSDGTALAGRDYTATSGTLTFAAGEVTQTISVTIRGDQVREPDETFFVRMFGLKGAAVGKGKGTGTIHDPPASDGLPLGLEHGIPRGGH